MATNSASTAVNKPVIVGSANFVYEAVVGWEQLPAGWSFYEAVGVATDSKDRVFVFCRGEHPVIVFDRDGKFLYSWGEGKIRRAHGIWIGPDDSVYLSDDEGHQVAKYTPEGELILALSTGKASDTGISGIDYRTIKTPAGPFNLPTNLALGPKGEMYVSDGYGNCRVHKFSPAGKLLFSWGELGSGPGQFHLPHGIGVDREGIVFVADRENNRLQLFTPEGKFIEEWAVNRPCEVFLDKDDNVFVAELGWRGGMFPWMTRDPNGIGGSVAIFNRKGELQSRFGGGLNPMAPGDFYVPHDLWVDSQGSLYVGEVTMSGGGKFAWVPADCPSLQKFVRRR
jgi:DNA-binding beta-propeller fold protein YncE